LHSKATGPDFVEIHPDEESNLDLLVARNASILVAAR